MRWGIGGALLVVLVTLALLGLGGCGSGGNETSAQSAQSATVEKVEQAALQEYTWYLWRKSRTLLEWTTDVWGQIVVNDPTRAESRYATARVQYGQLLPGAHFFPRLDRRINGQEGESEPFIGFHRIEPSLFEKESTAGLKQFGKLLTEDVKRLRHKFRAMKLGQTELAEASVELMKEILTKKLTGKEEPHSEIDLVDLSASVEGAEQAFRALRPLLASRDPELVLEIEGAFLGAYEALSRVGFPGRQPQERDPAAGAIFYNYGDLSKEELAEVAKPLRRLEGLFEQMKEQVTEAG